MTMYTESLRAFLRPVLPYLDDDEVAEILINGPTDIWVEKNGRLVKTNAQFTEEGLLGAARNMAQFVGRPLTEERPRLDARLPDGSRIHVVLPPMALQGPTVSIRKFLKNRPTLETLTSLGSLNPPIARFLDAIVKAKLNVVVAGGTGSGKTTLLNILAMLVPDEERIITLEDSVELQIHKPHVLGFEARPPDKNGKGEVDLGDLLMSALRLRPDRIVVGEVRAGECFYLMQAMNTGHGGTMSSAHANTPRDTLRRLESLCLMSAVEMPLVAVRAQVASAVQIVVCCERLADGTRKITSVAEVLPLNEHGEYRTQDLFVFTPLSRDANGRVVGYHAPTGLLPSFLPKLKALGFSDLGEAFFDPATYQVPPPPAFQAGETYTVRWAPSLKHRERGEPDPPSAKAAFQAFESRLKQPRAGGSPPSPTPKARPAVAARPLQAPGSMPTPPPGTLTVDEDKTPLPTPNPLLKRS